MKNYLYILCVFFFFLKGNAQDDFETAITSLRAPSSPAAQILGSQPSSITRPKTWNELEASLFTDFLTDDGDVNLNRLINIEVSPFWLKKDRKISTESFIYQDDPLENIKQNFTISFSTTNNLIIPDSLGQKNTSLGIGFRTMLWRGTKLEKEELERRYVAVQEDLKFTARLLPVITAVSCNACDRETFVDVFIAEMIKNRAQLFSSAPSRANSMELIAKLKEHLLLNLAPLSVDGSDYREYIDELAENKFVSELKRNVISLQEMIEDRKGFKLEVAGAFAVDFPTNETNFSTIPQWSVWATPSYQPYDTGWIEFLGVARYQQFYLDYYRPIVQQEMYQQSALDLGVKLVLKRDRLSFELEGLSRRARNAVLQEDMSFKEVTESDSKYVARLNYRISDALVFSYDFGKDFRVATNGNNTLISQFAINYAFGLLKKKDIMYGN